MEETTIPPVRDSLKKGLDILSRGKRQVNLEDEDGFEDYGDDILDDVSISQEEDEYDKKSVNGLEKTNSASYLLGLSVLMDAKSDNYYVAPENYVGFKVIFCSNSISMLKYDTRLQKVMKQLYITKSNETIVHSYIYTYSLKIRSFMKLHMYIMKIHLTQFFNDFHFLGDGSQSSDLSRGEQPRNHR